MAERLLLPPPPSPGTGVRVGAALSRPVVEISVEALLYGVVIVLAAGLRLAFAAREPLAVAESANALAALDLTWGRPTAGSAPLADVLGAFIFFVAGPSDLAARLPSVLAGAATVAIMPLFRPLLGRLAALVAAVLLAFGPFSLAIARRADADALAVLAGLVVILGLMRFRNEGHLGWAVTALIAMALLLTAGPRAVTLVLAGIVAVLLARILSVPTPLAALSRAWRTGGAGWTGPIGWAGIAALVAFVVISSRVFLEPSGLALPALNAWVREVTPGGSMAAPLVAVLSYDPLAVLVGVGGAIWLLVGAPRERRDRQLLAFLVIWAAVALVVALLGGQRLVGPLAAVAIPLTLLAATAIADAVRAVRRDDLSRGVALLGAVPLLVYAYIQSAVLTRSDGGTPLQWLAVLVSIALAGGYTLLVAFSLGRRGFPVIALAGSSVVLLGTLHASFALNARPTPAEWVLADVPGPAATLFPQLIADQRAARGGVLFYGVAPELRVPFAWYLRDQPGMRLTDGLRDGLGAAIVPAGAPAPDGEASAVRSVYAAGSYGPPAGGRAFWRWYVWRMPGETGFRREAVLLTR